MFFYWAGISFSWYLVLLIIGLVFLPLTSFIFNKFSDRGYPFAKIIGLAIFSYLFFLLSISHTAAFTKYSLAALLFLLLLINFFILKKTKVKLPKLSIIFGFEFFFLLLFALWSYLKGFEPSIHSLEKYMDFGFIQSILNTKFMPPQDMWFASTIKQSIYINYYYFGHFITAILIKLSSVMPAVGYNLMLASILGLSVTASFSLGFNLYQFLTKEKPFWPSILSGILSSAIMNFGGNLHTIYLFTKGYSAQNPAPFWQILSKYNPLEYWYPNATRFIPLTIHEFPSYSYIVSDLHGHVLDIPFVLLLIGLSFLITQSKKSKKLIYYLILFSLVLGINYMTNSTDFIVYSVILLFSLIILFDSFKKVLIYFIPSVFSALIFALPFSLNFKPFTSSIGLNCAPDFLVKLGSFGPLLFEADKCQTSPMWMLFVLWGFFWFIFLVFLKTIFFTKNGFLSKNKVSYYLFFVFVLSILFTLFAEFFYFKDIYPDHFRANTMFKLGYQAFIMLSICSGVTITYVLKNRLRNKKFTKLLFIMVLLPLLILVLIYYQYAIPSYFGKGNFISLNGSLWIKRTYPDTYKIIKMLNKIKQTEIGPSFNIVEAHGDSYTDFNIVSSQTGLPTIIGWPVHEWLWRGSYNIVAPRVSQVAFIYEGEQKDLPKIKSILNNYQIKFIVVAELEKQKYPQLKLQKFYKIGKPVYINTQTNNYLFQVYD